MNGDKKFNISFVLAIKKYEILYNYNLDKYTNKNAKELAWEKLAAEVKITVDECKKKWRMLRISFLRHMREKKPKSASRKKKKTFYLEDALEFLIPYIKSRSQTGNADYDNLDYDFKNSQDEIITNNNKTVISSDGVPNVQPSTPSNLSDESEEIEEMHSPEILEKRIFSSKLLNTPEESTAEKRKTIKSSENWESAAVECLTNLNNKYKKRRESVLNEEDSDLLFLRSLLPDIKKLNDAQKRRFKQKIFMIYDEILREDNVQ